MPTKRNTKSMATKSKKRSVATKPKRVSSKAKIQDNFFKRNFVAVLIFVLLFGAIGIYLIVTSHAQSYVELHAFGPNGLCISGNASQSSATLQQCDDSDHRLWGDISNSGFQIKSKNGLCLDDWNGGVQTKTIANGGTRVYVHYRQCTAGDNNELWSWNPNNIHQLRNDQSGGCINVLGGNNTVGSSLIVYSCNGDSNETFVKTGLSTGGGGGGTGGGGGLPSGTAVQLAQAILNNGRIHYESSSRTDVVDAAQGRVSTAGTKLSRTLLAMIVELGFHHSFTISALESNGQGHTAGSLHYTGDAVDITQVDGDPIANSGIGRTAADKAVISEWAPLMPSGSAFGQSQCGTTPPLPRGITTFADTCSHLHTQVPVGTP